MKRSDRRRSRRWEIQLGTIVGIPVSLHLTFLLLLAFVMVADSARGGPGALIGGAWLIALFACVVVHELSHSLVARRKGVTVRSILLLPIGGVSQMDRIPEYWKDELEIAAAGPLASFAIAVVSGAAALATGSQLVPIDIYGGGVLARLAWLNVLLGLFNLLPAFPLDGGRVLRAALERRHDRGTSTRVAANVGRAFAAAMVLVGLLWDFDLILILIGAFIWMGATAEERFTANHIRLRGLTVRNFMRAHVATVDASEASSRLDSSWTGPYIVTRNGSYLGLVSGGDLRHLDPGTRVGDLVDAEAPTLSPWDDLGDRALDLLVGSGYPALAVVEGGAVVGALVASDVASWLTAHSTSH